MPKMEDTWRLTKMSGGVCTMALNAKSGNATLNVILKQRPGHRTDLIGRMNDRSIWVRSDSN